MRPVLQILGSQRVANFLNHGPKLDIAVLPWFTDQLELVANRFATNFSKVSNVAMTPKSRV